MNTVQSTVGKGSYANPLEQTEVLNPQTDATASNPPLMLDNRQVLAAQTQLLDLIDSFMELDSPIVVITDFIEVWLSAKPDQMLDSYFRTYLNSALRLIAFLSELRDSHATLVRVEEITRSQKEVSNG